MLRQCTPRYVSVHEKSLSSFHNTHRQQPPWRSDPTWKFFIKPECFCMLGSQNVSVFMCRAQERFLPSGRPVGKQIQTSPVTISRKASNFSLKLTNFVTAQNGSGVLLYTHILLCYHHGLTKSVSAVLVLALKK